MVKAEVAWEGTITLRDQIAQSRVEHIPLSPGECQFYGASISHAHLTVCGRVPFTSVPELDVSNDGSTYATRLVHINMGDVAPFFENYFDSKKRVGLVPLAHDADTADDRLYILPSSHPAAQSAVAQSRSGQHAAGGWLYGIWQCRGFTDEPPPKKHENPEADPNLLRKHKTAPYPATRVVTKRKTDLNRHTSIMGQHQPEEPLSPGWAALASFTLPDSKPDLPPYITQEQLVRL